MGNTPESGDTGGASVAAVMGLEPGQMIQELGWDEDVDQGLREAIMDGIDADLVEDPYEAVDAVVLWWRDEDGDVGDGLVDALRDLSTTGHIWLMTPKVGRPGYVDPADIAEGTITAGLTLANPVAVSPDWLGQRIVRPRQGARR